MLLGSADLGTWFMIYWWFAHFVDAVASIWESASDDNFAKKQPNHAFSPVLVHCTMDGIKSDFIIDTDMGITA